MDKCTEERFLSDVADHEISVIRDDGSSRHVRFQKPGTGCMHFDLLTWPGHLCYTGDMGTYVFRRTEDMFQFFRNGSKGPELKINPSYWGGKLEAVDRVDGFREWSDKKFSQKIREGFEEWISESEFTNEQVAEVKAQFEDEIATAIDEGKDAAYRAVMGFEFNGDSPFQDWWEVDTDEFAFRFLWCCYAIAWGVHQYDKSKATGPTQE